MLPSIAGKYFDGKTSASYDIQLSIDDSGVVFSTPILFAPIEFTELKVSSRIGSLPRTIEFPDGALFESDEHENINDWLAQYQPKIDRAHILESKAAFAIGSLLFLIVFCIGVVFWGIPEVSKVIADNLPAKVNVYIGDNALESMDKLFFKPSELTQSRQDELRKLFESYVPKDSSDIQYQLFFRKSELIGANAFALPDGSVVITDELVKLAYTDEEIGSILLHEIGHVVHRHSLRQILNHTGLAILSAFLIGDVGTAGTLVLGLPNVLMNTAYSRDLEWEADGYALEKMQELNIPTDHFANIMSRMELEYISDDSNSEKDIFDYMSSHPPSPDRIARFQTEEGKKALALIDKPEIVVDEEDISRKNNPLFPDIFKLRGLLEAEDFTSLHKQLDQYQRDIEEGHGSEITLDTAYRRLAYADPNNEVKFTAWITAMPDAYTAYIARAEYYRRASWKNRGTAYIKDTSEIQLEGMRKYEALAEKDLAKALELKPNSMIVYSRLISIEGNGGNEDKQWDYYYDAINIVPHTYVVRRDMMYYLLPRWGGSYYDIDYVIDEAKPHLEKNPDLQGLMGYNYYAKSFKTYSNKQYDKTIRLNTVALKSGKKSWFYKKRAYAYYQLEDYDSSYIDLVNAIYFNPYDSELHYWRANVLYKLGKEEAALKDFEYAARIEPYDKSTQNWLAWFYNRLGRYEESRDAFKKALYYNSEDTELLYNYGKMLNKDLKDYDEAQTVLSKAVSLKPENAKYWYEYAGALNALHDCEVVPAFESYLKLCKNPDAEGCFEKGIDWSKNLVAKLKQTHCKEN